MSNVPYIHVKKDKKSLIKAYYLALIPLMIFGFYKNGILLYQNELISFGDLIIPLYFYFISVIIGFVVAKIYHCSWQEMVLFALILSCSVSINTNMLIYPILLFASLFISKYLSEKVCFNTLALSRLMLVFALLMQSYSYMNVGEKLGVFNYNLFDVFLGYGISGIASGSLFFLIIGFFFLLFLRFYKKMIPLFASLSYLFVLFLVFFITKQSDYLTFLCNGTVYFGFIFIGAHLYTSPDTKKGMIVYGCAIGLLAGILTLFVPVYEVSYLSIFIVSFFIPLINRVMGPIKKKR